MVGEAQGRGTVTLDHYVRSTGVRPTVVKMDVEGAEVFVLQGIRQLLDERRTDFLIEIHPPQIAALGSSLEELLHIFPGDFRLMALPEIRDSKPAEWTSDLGVLFEADQPYLYAGPCESQRSF